MIFIWFNLVGAKTKFNDIQLNTVLERFRDKFTDRAGRAYIAFAPRNNLTVQLMQIVLIILQIDKQNKVLPVDRHSSYGAVSRVFMDTYLEGLTGYTAPMLHTIYAISRLYLT
jgi:hypothetical protein